LGRWKLTKERALAVTGIKTVLAARFWKGIIRNDDSCRDYLHQYEWTLQSGRNWTREARFVKWWEPTAPIRFLYKKA
jgi:hypothetical protein